MLEPSPPVSVVSLQTRLGSALFDRRLRRQADLWARKTHQGEGIFLLERYLPVDFLIRVALGACGLWRSANRHFLDIRIVRHEITVPRLPAAFDGFRLLQLTDLHCDIDSRLVDVVIAKLHGLEYDLAVLTGDYHNKIGTDYRESLEAMTRLAPHLAPGAVGVLGNHDFIEKVIVLERSGLRMLLNENVAIERGGAAIWICGVDDPHFFRTHDLARARAGVPAEGCTILLSHSPETYKAAAGLGFDVCLSGHTHGGQLCLPGGIPMYLNARVPPAMVAGAWTYGAMAGYTSRGTGACGVPARLFCPPEITLHTLRRP